MLPAISGGHLYRIVSSTVRCRFSGTVSNSYASFILGSRPCIKKLAATTSPNLLQVRCKTVLHARKELPGFHENISALQTKTRVQRRRATAEESPTKGWTVVGYTTAEEYNLEHIKEAIKQQQLYNVVEDHKAIITIQENEKSQGSEDVLHLVALYNVEEEPREIFLFREGTAVFWNVSELEMSNLMRFLRPFEETPYDERLVRAEKEYMTYLHGETKKSALREGNIVLSNLQSKNLEKYTFSNAIALSVKLGVWESSLSKFVDSIEEITTDLKMGRKIKITRQEILRKQGELFALRHLINLSSDLLDTPDFYWDNEELESLYMQTVAYFSINRRTRVMNEKLNHCVELVELVSSNLSDKHHVRLEWMIIVLIMVEVAFEFLHFMK